MTTLLISPAQVTDEELARYAALVYDKAGIRISPQKKALLSNRLRRRLKETGIADYQAYLQHLRRLPAGDPEWDAFLQEITTHETYLFRDDAQWQWMQQTLLPELAAAARRGERPRSLRVWSAACSTGDEAYTAACCIAAALPNFSQWRIDVLGTDIGVGAVAQAKRGEFNERAMRQVPEDLRRRYFVETPIGPVWRAKPVLCEMVRFRQHNLLEPLRGEPPFDLVLLKNVLIYFDRDSKIRVLHQVSNQLSSGGTLISGAAEGVSDLLSGFQRIEPWLFRKQ